MNYLIWHMMWLYSPTGDRLLIVLRCVKVRKAELYVCMYVCVYVCMYVRVCVCVYVRTYVRMYVCMYVVFLWPHSSTTLSTPPFHLGFGLPLSLLPVGIQLIFFELNVGRINDTEISSKNKNIIDFYINKLI
jgi:hypothetical protein